MLTDINPKLPMRNKAITRDFYLNKLDFKEFGSTDYEGYLMVQKTIFKFIFLSLKSLTPRRIMDKFISERMILTHCTNHF